MDSPSPPADRGGDEYTETEPPFSPTNSLMETPISVSKRLQVVHRPAKHRHALSVAAFPPKLSTFRALDADVPTVSADPPDEKDVHGDVPMHVELRGDDPDSDGTSDNESESASDSMVLRKPRRIPTLGSLPKTKQSGEEEEQVHFKVNWATLEFRDREFEDEFRMYYFDKYGHPAHSAVLLGGLIWQLFLVHDIMQELKGNRKDILAFCLIRVAVLVLYLLALLGFRYGYINTLFRMEASLGVVIGAMGLAQVIFGVVQEDSLDPVFICALILIPATSSTFFRQRCSFTVVLSLFVLVVFAVLTLIFESYQSVGVFVLGLLGVSCVILLAGWHAYKRERFIRHDYCKIFKLILEQERCRNTLLRMLPESIVTELKSGQDFIYHWHESVSLLFSHVSAFDLHTASSSPIQIVTLLNRLFSAFDEIIDLYDVYKVETIGDVYVVSCGCPEEVNHPDHTATIAVYGLHIQRVTESMHVEGQRRVRIQVGVHTGPIIAGVIGFKYPRYRLMGDTINMTSRMSTTVFPGHIQLSEAAYERVNYHNDLVRRHYAEYFALHDQLHQPVKVTLPANISALHSGQTEENKLSDTDAAAWPPANPPLIPHLPEPHNSDPTGVHARADASIRSELPFAFSHDPASYATVPIEDLPFRMFARGHIPVKGKGVLPVWLLLSSTYIPLHLREMVAGLHLSLDAETLHEQNIDPAFAGKNPKPPIVKLYDPMNAESPSSDLRLEREREIGLARSELAASDSDASDDDVIPESQQRQQQQVITLQEGESLERMEVFVIDNETVRRAPVGSAEFRHVLVHEGEGTLSLLPRSFRPPEGFDQSEAMIKLTDGVSFDLDTSSDTTRTTRTRSFISRNGIRQSISSMGSGRQSINGRRVSGKVVYKRRSRTSNFFFGPVERTNTASADDSGFSSKTWVKRQSLLTGPSAGSTRALSHRTTDPSPPQGSIFTQDNTLQAANGAVLVASSAQLSTRRVPEWGRSATSKPALSSLKVDRKSNSPADSATKMGSPSTSSDHEGGANATELHSTDAPSVLPRNNSIGFDPAYRNTPATPRAPSKPVSAITNESMTTTIREKSLAIREFMRKAQGKGKRMSRRASLIRPSDFTSLQKKPHHFRGRSMHSMGRFHGKRPSQMSIHLRTRGPSISQLPSPILNSPSGPQSPVLSESRLSEASPPVSPRGQASIARNAISREAHVGTRSTPVMSPVHAQPPLSPPSASISQAGAWGSLPQAPDVTVMSPTNGRVVPRAQTTGDIEHQHQYHRHTQEMVLGARNSQINVIPLFYLPPIDDILDPPRPWYHFFTLRFIKHPYFERLYQEAYHGWAVKTHRRWLAVMLVCFTLMAAYDIFNRASLELEMHLVAEGIRVAGLVVGLVFIRLSYRDSFPRYMQWGGAFVLVALSLSFLTIGGIYNTYWRAYGVGVMLMVFDITALFSALQFVQVLAVVGISWLLFVFVGLAWDAQFHGVSILLLASGFVFTHASYANELITREDFLRSVEHKANVAVSARILRRMLPKVILEMVKSQEDAVFSSIAHCVQDVDVLMCDIVSFTSLSSRLKPEDIVAMLNVLFSTFDGLTTEHKVYKVETIGDAYLACSGLVNESEHHSENLVRFGLAMQDSVSNFVTTDMEPIRVRVGIHTGPVVAGVVGLKMPRYHLFGETVTIAEEIESQGIPDAVVISDATRKSLIRTDGMVFRALEPITMKKKVRVRRSILQAQRLAYVSSSSSDEDEGEASESRANAKEGADFPVEQKTPPGPASPVLQRQGTNTDFRRTTIKVHRWHVTLEPTAVSVSGGASRSPVPNKMLSVANSLRKSRSSVNLNTESSAVDPEKRMRARLRQMVFGDGKSSDSSDSDASASSRRGPKRTLRKHQSSDPRVSSHKAFSKKRHTLQPVPFGSVDLDAEQKAATINNKPPHPLLRSMTAAMLDLKRGVEWGNTSSQKKELSKSKSGKSTHSRFSSKPMMSPEHSASETGKIVRTPPRSPKSAILAADAWKRLHSFVEDDLRRGDAPNQVDPNVADTPAMLYPHNSPARATVTPRSLQVQPKDPLALSASKEPSKQHSRSSAYRSYDSDDDMMDLRALSPRAAMSSRWSGGNKPSHRTTIHPPPSHTQEFAHDGDIDAGSSGVFRSNAGADGADITDNEHADGISQAHDFGIGDSSESEAQFGARDSVSRRNCAADDGDKRNGSRRFLQEDANDNGTRPLHASGWVSANHPERPAVSLVKLWRASTATSDSQTEQSEDAKSWQERVNRSHSSSNVPVHDKTAQVFEKLRAQNGRNPTGPLNHVVISTDLYVSDEAARGDSSDISNSTVNPPPIIRIHQSIAPPVPHRKAKRRRKKRRTEGPQVPLVMRSKSLDTGGSDEPTTFLEHSIRFMSGNNPDCYRLDAALAALECDDSVPLPSPGVYPAFHFRGGDASDSESAPDDRKDGDLHELGEVVVDKHIDSGDGDRDGVIDAEAAEKQSGSCLRMHYVERSDQSTAPDGTDGTDKGLSSQTDTSYSADNLENNVETVQTKESGGSESDADVVMDSKSSAVQDRAESDSKTASNPAQNTTSTCNVGANRQLTVVDRQGALVVAELGGRAARPVDDGSVFDDAGIPSDSDSSQDATIASADKHQTVPENVENVEEIRETGAMNSPSLNSDVRELVYMQNMSSGKRWHFE